jgi:hypothetical protein
VWAEDLQRVTQPTKGVVRKNRTTERGSMSANNQLLIRKYLDGYRVADVDVEGSGGHWIQDEPVKTLEEAVELANKYMRENEVEYGISIDQGVSMTKVDKWETDGIKFVKVDNTIYVEINCVDKVIEEVVKTPRKESV